MGWFLCIAAPRGHPARERLGVPARYAASFEADTARLRLVGGGPARTFRARHEGEAVAVVAGVGVEVQEDVDVVLSDAALLVLAATRRLRPGLGGGLALLHHDGRTLWAATDAVGLRNLYAVRLAGGGLAVGTHLDLVAPFLPSVRLDAQALAGYRAGVHQMSHRALLAGVERLGPGGSLRVDADGRLTVERQPWTGEGTPPRRFDAVLRLRTEDGAKPPLSLGLSGGYDSRTVLGHLLADRACLRLHTFGLPDHPDVVVAHRLAARTGLDLRHESPPADDPDALADALDRWCVPTNGVTPASAASRFVVAAPAALADPDVRGGRLGVDGGFGEIGRGVFFKRLALALLRDPAASPEALVPFVAAPPAWLAPEAVPPVVDDLADALAALPPFRRRDVRAWMARFAVRTLAPGTYGYAQDGYDLHAPMLAPAAHPAFLAAVLRGGARTTGYTVAPALRTVPLVKGTAVVPFSSSLALQAWRVRRAARRRGPFEAPMQRFAAAHLRTLEPLVRDWAAADGLAASGVYDTAWLRAAVGRFYAGDEALALPLDAWLAFEAWRRALGATR